MNLPQFEKEINVELNRILDYWEKFSPDIRNGGFLGEVDILNQPDYNAPKGGVLNARILWSFSAAFAFTQNPVHKNLAQRAYEYICRYFLDQKSGGTYWSLNADGTVLDGRKQTYGLAFTLYAFAEYFKITSENEVLEQAQKLFFELEEHAFDPKNGGYWEAFSQNWEKLDDVRLSEKDRNDPKTMNTHLHIIEAYANLYQIWPDALLKKRIIHLLEVFEKHIINPKTWQLQLFFDAQWLSQSAAYSYGHNIEASWLLYESAEIIEDAILQEKWSEIAIKMADATSEGCQPDGSLLHEYDPETKHTDTHREWWVSAEGMVGYLNVFQLKNNREYMHRVEGFWDFIKKHLLDLQNGEWFWGVDDAYRKVNEGKVSFWKCPYHNVRACLEILKRIKTIKSCN